MIEPPLIQQQRTVLNALARLAAERAATEAEIEAQFKAQTEANEKEYQEGKVRVRGRYDADKTAAERDYQLLRQTSATRFEAEHAAGSKEYKETREHLADRFEAESERAEKEYKEACWTVKTVCDAKKREVEEPFKEVDQKVAASLIRVEEIRAEAKAIVREWWQHGRYTDVEIPLAGRKVPQQPLPAMKKYSQEAEGLLTELKGLRLPRWFTPKRLLALLAVLWVGLSVALFQQFPSGLVAGKYPWYAVSTGGAILLQLTFSGLLYAIARLRTQGVFHSLVESLADIQVAAERARELATQRYQAQLGQMGEESKERKLKRVEEKYEKLTATIQERRDQGLAQADEKYPKLLAALEQRRDNEFQQAEEKYRRQLQEIKQRAEAEAWQVEEKYRRTVEENKKRREAGWEALTSKWQQGIAQGQAVVVSVFREARRLFPEWTDPSWKNWTPPKALPPAIRFGELQVKPEMPAVLAPPDPRWQMSALPRFALPALVPFPQRASMLFRVKDAGRAPAIQTMQAMMLRFLTALPPGKVRFTIVDPVGLGENFAAFMHLADYDEQLVSNRIWTEPQQIEQRLTDMALHMENVIQKYLRNQYRSIEEYNAAAGEVAEPFRVLVVANFPVNFNADAAKRLVSIAASGASCGVYALVTADTQQPMPEGFNLADLEQACSTLVWDEKRFLWKDSDFGKYRLQLDPPPADAEFCTRILHQVGAAAKDANRVEVDFSFIAPAVEGWWTASTQRGVDVPLGRAGATKRQHLQLGHGTAQHVLIAGKTGSGKSTLLHALITNLAMVYSPEELELYLVDFKKGVEFKTYANHELPHARVVAVESEREFGLSVLQRLDAELKRRGERFRSVGTNDVNTYRQATKKPLPRILLIVDEFQEFFTEDDKIAQEAALLLDRLVRQGRAFGLHILLGSQTLGGAYTLARSTIDQMAVRIALQCSEADAHLILSKDNSAARLLSRPGEAIYNDQNGLVEGNDIFQVVWLPDARREQYLRGVRERARKLRWVPPHPQLVFEGNAPADVHKNPLLVQAIQAPRWPAAVRSASAWLGEAIAIKDPTAAVFRRQTSNNLLLLGQHDEAALGILATGLIALGSQHNPAKDSGAGARFCILDGSPADAANAGTLARVATVLPHPVQTGGWRELPALMTEIAEEVDRRQKTNEGEYPSIYLVIYGLQRFRELRKGDDDFSFSRREEAVSPAKQLATILKEGPGVGIHALIWCDSLNNFYRSLERQALREFEMRIMFQMSVADSTALIDTPLASKLGMNRALFHSEDLALPEKFRPYSLPTAEWLAEVKQRLEAKRAPQGASAGV